MPRLLKGQTYFARRSNPACPKGSKNRGYPSDEVTSNIKKILDRAGDEIKQYLEQELKTLEDKFSKIKVTNEDS